MKKILCTLVCLMMLFVTACQVEEATPEETKKASETSTKSTETETIKEVKKEQEPLEFTVVSDMINWTRDNLDVNESVEAELWSELTNTKITYITPPHSEAPEKINLLIASGDYPDVIDNSPNSMKYAKEGIFISLEEYWQSPIGQQAILDYYNVDDVFVLVTLDGERFGIPHLADVYARKGTMVRADWLEALDLEAPETLDDYRAVLNAFTFNDPDGNGENDTYGFTARGDLSYADTFLGAFGIESHRHVTYDLIDGKIVAEQTQDDFKSYLEYMRGLIFEDKVFVPDAALNTSDQWKEDMFASRAGMWQHDIVRIDQYFMTNMMLANPDWEEKGIRIEFLVPPTGGPNTGKTGLYNSLPVSGGIYITDLAEEPERIFEYFMGTNIAEEAIDFVKYGLENRDYKVVDGNKQWVEGVFDGIDLLRVREVVNFWYYEKVDSEIFAAQYGQRALDAKLHNEKYNQAPKTFLLGKPVLSADDDYPDTDSVVIEYSLKIMYGEIGVEEGFAEMQEMLIAKGLNHKLDAYQQWYDETH